VVEANERKVVIEMWQHSFQFVDNPDKSVPNHPSRLDFAAGDDKGASG